MHFQDFDLQKVMTTLKGITDTAKSVSGPLAALGLPYAGLVNSGLSIAQTLEQRISDGTVVAESSDHDQVKQIITDLQAANDKLAAEVDQS